MSSALLKRSLEIVENSDRKKNKPNKNKDKIGYQSQEKVEKNNDKTETINENLHKLLKLSKNKPNLDEETSKMIIKRGVTKRYVLTDKSKAKIQESIFTDEDFEKFAREYVP